MHLPSVVGIVSLLLLAVRAQDVPECPRNEEFDPCGSACPPTCQERDPQICTDQCVPGCVCQKGYIRAGPGGRCVPESCEGVPICKENEQFSTCASACPKICNQTEPRICPLICLTGCVCKRGFIREREDGACIPITRCSRCGENEVYSDCGSMCPGTCSEPVKNCPKGCARGCFCREGYVRDEKTGRCVNPKECPDS